MDKIYLILNNLIAKVTSPEIIKDFSQIVISVIVAFIIHLIIKHIAGKYIDKIVKKTKTNIDDILLENGVIKNLLYLVPIIISYALVQDIGVISSFSDQFFTILIIVQSMRVFYRLIYSLEQIFLTLNNLKGKNLKIILQIVQIFVTIVSVLLISAVILDSSLLKILSGIGAMTAVLMLIFKDTILSFSASFHISMNKLIEVGDWIEMPTFKVDGDVVDISLNNVKVQNFDKTIVSVPKHKFLDTPFINWKGMQNSGGRRIKRNIYIDQTTIKFCSEEFIARIKKIDVLKEFLDARLKEIESYNSQIDNDEVINNRALTNIGIFRYYITYYLKHSENIRKDYTLMVRQLEPTDRGLPLQLYCFTNTTVWADYEGIQSDVFDHLLSIISLFELKVYQLPSGSDFSKI